MDTNKFIITIDDYYPCTFMLCNKIYNTRDKLENHKTSHIWEKVYTCNYDGCDYKSLRKINLESHIRRMHNIQQNSSYSGIDLRITQNDIPRYPCSYEGCHYRARSQYYLTNHIKKHGNSIRTSDTSIDNTQS